MLEELTALQIVDRVDRCFIIPPELVKECETPTIEMPELKRGYNGLEIKKVYDYAESTVKNTIIPDSTKEKLLSALRKGSITGNRVIPYIAAMIQNRKTYFTSREFSEEMFGEYSDRTLRVSSSEIDMAIKAGLVEKSGWGIKTRYEISPELFEETASTEVAVATEETVTFEDTRRTEEMVKNEDDFWAAITRPDEDEYDDDLWEAEETSEDELISVETA